MQIYKLKPYFSEKLWGGTKLKELGFEIPDSKKIGEAWIISAHDNGMSVFSDGPFSGQGLKTVFENNRNLFGNFQGEDYPLLVKIITANDYLSVQVHPNDEYAKTHNNDLGKPESWYVLEPPTSGKLIYGHNAKTPAQLSDWIKAGEWKKLLKEVDVQKDDFLYVPVGKIHAITPGTTVYELQRSSDVTYRVYDFDRTDDKGNRRSLDLDDSLAVTTVPDSKDVIARHPEKEIYSGNDFSLYLLDATKETTFNLDSLKETPFWLQLTVIDGEGTINGQSFQKMDSAIGIDGLENLTVTGSLKILISWIKK